MADSNLFALAEAVEKAQVTADSLEKNKAGEVYPSVTLLVSGILISGTVISSEAYRGLVKQRFPGPSKSYAATLALSHLGGESIKADGKNLYLRGVTVEYGAGALSLKSLALGLESIQGWSVETVEHPKEAASGAASKHPTQTPKRK